MLVKSVIFGELVLSDFYHSIRKEITMASADIALVCGLNFQVLCQDKLCVNLIADESLAKWNS